MGCHVQAVEGPGAMKTHALCHPRMAPRDYPQARCDHNIRDRLSRYPSAITCLSCLGLLRSDAKRRLQHIEECIEKVKG